MSVGLGRLSWGTGSDPCPTLGWCRSTRVANGRRIPLTEILFWQGRKSGCAVVTGRDIETRYALTTVARHPDRCGAVDPGANLRPLDSETYRLIRSEAEKSGAAGDDFPNEDEIDNMVVCETHRVAIRLWCPEFICGLCGNAVAPKLKEKVRSLGQLAGANEDRFQRICNPCYNKRRQDRRAEEKAAAEAAAVAAAATTATGDGTAPKKVKRSCGLDQGSSLVQTNAQMTAPISAKEGVRQPS
eukprot:m.407610 g.407610  ORF g.407610 m.407610 type:complete len:243 (-) comp16798_c0_seq26:1967-2695(-)